MVQCFASQCNHRSGDPSGRCLVNISFPKEKKSRNRWISAVCPADETPNKSSRLCTCHFKQGDYTATPSLFAWNASNTFDAFQSPEKRTRKRKKRSAPDPVTVIEPSVTSTTSIVDYDALNFHSPHGDMPSYSTGFSSRATTSNDKSEIEVLVKPISTTEDFKWSRPEIYKAELYFKDKEIDELRKEISRLRIHSFSCQSITSEKLWYHYTGIGKKVFQLFVQLCKSLPINYYNDKAVRKLPLQDQVLLTFMKLRMNSTYLDLGVRFGVSSSTAFNIVYAILPTLHQVVKETVLHRIPSQRKIKTSMPASFKSFTNCRLIMDCTEMECKVPRNMREQRMTYSAYKNRNTVKVLTAVAPNGALLFCSDAYPGSSSDKEVVKHSGVLDTLESGDLILADKGFLLHNILPPGVALNIPPFLNLPQFSKSEVEETRNIARARIHVERANIRLKRYRILHRIPKSLFKQVSMVIQVCVGLVNFQNPLLKCMAQDFLLSETDAGDDVNLDECCE